MKRKRLVSSVLVFGNSTIKNCSLTLGIGDPGKYWVGSSQQLMLSNRIWKNKSLSSLQHQQMGKTCNKHTLDSRKYKFFWEGKVGKNTINIQLLRVAMDSLYIIATNYTFSVTGYKPAFESCCTFGLLPKLFPTIISISLQLQLQAINII